MSKRSIFSISQIERMMATSRRIQREKEKEEIIRAQGGDKKELEPTYSLVKVDFNIETRLTKLLFKEEQYYRTIEKYITQNYIKYPIYSDWKKRTKEIKKSLKLTNEVLENLNNYNDFLIKKFSKDIITELHNEELFPSWFIREFLSEEYRNKIQSLENNFNIYSNDMQIAINQFNSRIDVLRNSNNELSISLNKKEENLKKINNKLEKISTAKKSILLDILSLFIRKYILSKHRIKKLLNKRVLLENEIQKLTEEIKINKEDINNLFDLIRESQNQINKKLIELNNAKKEEFAIYYKKQASITKLPTEIINNVFIPLKNIIGIPYKKIIGCYILRNIENQRCYVGQSKDVYKRLRQHFKGTIPNNIIFAEDYYSSKLDNKEILFEVSIIPCETKDELDETERNLIELYEAFTKGYNGTAGNK